MTEENDDSIQQFVDLYLYKGFEFPKEDIVVEQIKRRSLDELYNYSTKCNDSLLHIATYFNKHKIVDALLEKKMYVDYPNYHNETPLHYAACYHMLIKDDITIMEKLIKHGANINAVSMSEIYKNCNIGNITPLKYAISQGAINSIKCLVKHGAYVTMHSISKCKRHIQEHMFTDEDYMMLIQIKWSYMSDEYEKKLDNNLNMVISHLNKNDKYIPKELIDIVRSFMGYDEKEIIEIIRVIERK
jgi:ankyrin repeat protein